MRIIHTSDWHLGISLNNASLLEEQKNFIDYLIHIVSEQNIDAVIIAGDVFDHSVSSSEAISLYNEAVTKLCNKLGIPVIISAGNHDGASRLASCNELLKKSGLHVFGKVKRNIDVVELNGIDIYVLPYFNTDEIKALYPDEKINTYKDAMSCCINNIKQNFKPGKKNILMCHCFVSGSVLSESDRSCVVGGTSVVPAEIFDGFDYVALGHLHKAQNRGFNARYSGSPLKYSFGESEHKKTITIVDFSDEIHIEELAIIPLREIRVIKGTFEEVVKIAENDKKKDDYIKIEIIDKYAGMEAVELFRTYYDNLLNITGKTNETEENELTVEELYNLSPDDILKRFYLDATGSDIEEEHAMLFKEALTAVENEECELQ